jgi:hypothetical protein
VPGAATGFWTFDPDRVFYYQKLAVNSPKQIAQLAFAESPHAPQHAKCWSMHALHTSKSPSRPTPPRDMHASPMSKHTN